MSKDINIKKAKKLYYINAYKKKTPKDGELELFSQYEDSHLLSIPKYTKKGVQSKETLTKMKRELAYYNK